jgi:hypothetical protein
MPLPGRLANGLGMKEQIRPSSLAISLAAILKKMKWSHEVRQSL